MLEIRTGGVVQVRNSDKIGNMGVGPVLVRPWASQVPQDMQSLVHQSNR